MFQFKREQAVRDYSGNVLAQTGQQGDPSMKFKTFIKATVCTFLATPVLAQGVTPASGSQQVTRATETIVVTGSRIRRQALDSATPITVITAEDLTRDSISSSEQLIMSLNSNGNGVDNLASQTDVAGDASQRNVNGLSAPNLRGQGSGATLVLLNGRRVATHGLASNGAVDVGQFPLAAMKRVEILKDGASAIYGTDAVGGVMNYILKEDFQGLQANVFGDIAEAGGGEIFSGSLLGGWGDIADQGFNIMGVVTYREAAILKARDRDWINTQDVARGLAVDTRGTPFATIFPLAGSLFGTTGATQAPFLPGSTTQRANAGLNVLDLPGNLGCNAIADQLPYREDLWAIPGAALSCAYDTGRAGILQQPNETLSYIVRGVAKLGAHKVALEYMGSNATAAREFSEIQIVGGTGGASVLYPRNATSQATYDRIFNQLQAAFPGQIPATSRGLGINYRFRCMECGPRRADTETDTGRAVVTVEGPLPFSDWTYDLGYIKGFSEATTVTGGGYYYRGETLASGTAVYGLRDLLRSGVFNPFLLPGETQSAEAMRLLATAEARGINIASGRAEVQAFDASVTGTLFKLPAGSVQAAFGFDIREETFSFLGESRAATARPFIEGAPIDSKPDLADRTRDVTAFYAEFLIPVLKDLEISLAVRQDDYSGIGKTTNPKVTVRYRPIDTFAFRGSYNTGFRAPSFSQLFDPISSAPYLGADLTDPAICPLGRINAAITGCGTALTGLIAVTGGKPDLQPEEAEQFTFGVVIEPFRGTSLTVDYWKIERTNVPAGFSPQTLAANYALFTDRFVRNSANQIVAIDQRTVNSGETVTAGIEISGRHQFEALSGKFNLSLDGTMLTEKKERLLPSVPFSPSLIGVFSFYGDLGIKWKHTLKAVYERGKWSASLTQLFRSGYLNQVLPGVSGGLISPPNLVQTTDDYINYSASVGWKNDKGFSWTLGIVNLLDSEPPFAVSYNSGFGNGANWEPRVADPRGRAFTLNLGYAF
jgi:iron complex outermembrane recepter protein